MIVFGPVYLQPVLPPELALLLAAAVLEAAAAALGEAAAAALGEAAAAALGEAGAAALGEAAAGEGVPVGAWDDDGWLELVRMEPEHEPPKAVGLLDEGLDTMPQELDVAHQPQLEYCRHCAFVGNAPLKNAQMSSMTNPTLDAAHTLVVWPSITMHVSRVFAGRPVMPMIYTW